MMPPSLLRHLLAWVLGALIVVWAFVVAPKADNPLSQPARDIIGTFLLLVAATGLAVAGQPQLALVFAVVVVGDWLALVVIAWRVPGKLLWDSKNLRFTNSAEANKYVKPMFRKGWDLKL